MTARSSQLPEGRERRQAPPDAWEPSLRIVAAYLVVTSVWIAFSDHVAALLVSDEAALTRIQTIKGWAFVIVSSVGLFFLIRNVIRVIGHRAFEQARSDELLQEIFANSPLGIVIVDREGNYRRVNKAFAEMLGYSQVQLAGMNFRHVTFPDDIDLTGDLYERSDGTGDRRVLVEKRYVRADGSLIWAYLTGSLVHLGDEDYAVGIIQDISERKAAEAERTRTFEELRALSEERQTLLERLMIAEEVERRRIAGDIHDDSLQVMTAALLQIDLARRPDLLPVDRERMLVDARERLEDAMRRLRNLVFDLRPPLLDQHGLAPALDRFLEESKGDSNVRWRIQDRATGEVPRTVAAVAYRVAREAIGNALRHAAASHIEISLATEGGRLVVRVSDNGKGLEASDLRSREHFGIQLMEEHVSRMGGSLVFGGDAGRSGTTVDFWLPLHPPVEETQLTLDVMRERDAG